MEDLAFKKEIRNAL